MIDNNTMTVNDKELIIKDGGIAILNKEGKKVFETDIKGDITINYNDLINYLFMDLNSILKGI